LVASVSTQLPVGAAIHPIDSFYAILLGERDATCDHSLGSFVKTVNSETRRGAPFKHFSRRHGNTSG
jgi:hypothetical protein